MATSADTKKFLPTEAQAAAIERSSVPMAVDAAAGSGKTAVLIRRILNIVGDDWARLENVLAITFTEKAAAELRAKLRPFVPADERFRLDQAWIGTFHSFCARLLRRFGPSIDLDPSFTLLDEHQAALLVRKCVHDTLLALLDDGDEAAANLVEEIGYTTAAGALEELMQFRWHADAALTAHDEAEGWEVTALEGIASVFDGVRRVYLERLSELGALDFQELETRALELLEKRPVANACRAMFGSILVDEYQDTNDIQTELVLKLFSPPQNRLFIVGDEAQSIYRFRGANVSCFARVRELIEKNRGETVRLAHNFRSRRSIISFVNLSQEVLADGLFSSPSSPKAIEAVKGDEEHKPVIRLVMPSAEKVKMDTLREREARAIASMIAERAEDGAWSYGDVVLLFRAMSSATIYESALRRKLIPCSSIGGRGFLERTEVTDIMAALRYAADPEDAVALLALLRSPIGGMSDDELATMAGSDGRALPSAVERNAKLSLINELPTMAAHMRPSEIIRRVINESGLELVWSNLDPSGAALSNMDRLMTIARDLERDMSTTLPDFASFMSEMRRRGAKLGDAAPVSGNSGAVRLMTVHAAKGLEFPVVFLPDLMRKQPANRDAWIFARGDASGNSGFAFKKRDPALPFGKRIKTERFTKLSDEESARGRNESKRLLYVAMTRAIDSLVIPTHEGMKDTGTWHEWIRLTLESEMGREISESVSPSTRTDARKASVKLERENAFKTLPFDGAGTAMRLSVSQLDSYSVCPMQYYLKYVLGLPANEVTRSTPNLLEPNIYGSIVHAMLARATSDEKELSEAARAECLSLGVTSDDRLMRDLMSVAKDAISLVGPESPDHGARELPFELVAGKHTISGTIDWLRPVDGGYEIVDYKTGTEKESKLAEKAEQYEMQMQAYSLAAESITGERIVSTKLVFPAAGKVIGKRMTVARRDAAKRNIERIVAGIEARDYEIRTGHARSVKAKPPCESCIYKRNGMCWKTAGTRKKRKRK